MSDVTSKIASLSTPFGSRTVTENCRGPLPNAYGVGVTLRSMIFSSGSDRGTRGDFSLASLQAGNKTVTEPHTASNPSKRLIRRSWSKIFTITPGSCFMNEEGESALESDYYLPTPFLRGIT